MRFKICFAKFQLFSHLRKELLGSYFEDVGAKTLDNVWFAFFLKAYRVLSKLMEMIGHRLHL